MKYFWSAEWMNHIPERAARTLRAPLQYNATRTLIFGMYQSATGVQVIGYVSVSQVVKSRRRYATEQAALAALESTKKRYKNVPHSAVWKLCTEE